VSDGKYWDKAWSLVDGCTKVSPGCDHCWLRDMDKRFHPENLEGVRWRWDRFKEPLKRKKPTVYAVWSDLFHEAVPTDFIEKAFGVMGQLPGHTFLVLTKRPERALAMMPDIIDATQDLVFGFDNVCFGTTAENQEQADKRIPILLQIPAAHRFVSIEPMLGPIELSKCWLCKPEDLDNCFCEQEFYGSLDWVILGGETGHGARPMHPDWVRSVRDQCQAAGVPFWFKGWGTYEPDRTMGYGKGVVLEDGTKMMRGNGRLLDGREWNEVPWGINAKTL
jgi:protein gp37